MTTPECLTLLFGSEWRQCGRCPWWWVSVDGRIATTSDKQTRLLRGGIRAKYRCVMRRVGTRIENYPIHTLVCETFHGPRPTGYEVRHFDGNRMNNTAANVSWATRKDNLADKIRHGTAPIGARNPAAKLTLEQVSRIRELRRMTGMPYWTLGELFGVSTTTAHRVVKEITWK